AQADWGYIQSAPSTVPAGSSFTYEGGARLHFGPEQGEDGEAISAATPSPCPGGLVFFSAKPVDADPGAFGLMLVGDDWGETLPVPKLLFDDPALVDAEPVAVYPRAVASDPGHRQAPVTGYRKPELLRLADGRDHVGPMGYVENLAVRDAIRS